MKQVEAMAKAICAVNRTDKGEPINDHSWPKNTVRSIECRKRDLVIRIANWLRDKDEPAIEVECYFRGVFDWNESQSFTRFSGLTPKRCRDRAIKFAQDQILKFTPKI